eukprot:CAMPEP_0171634360 /NCGR_PEP_ID=MMETSP0990-20121206/25876_1 /TAXON_ID=483369 /ORGANISM="non described non described, Strain CCMP2098" /LENGTH=225 /DNA_ID=CAMNT_0012205501 /DNA_START=154 /DNA_END=831 /DNA_ORIENTATION=-
MTPTRSIFFTLALLFRVAAADSAIELIHSTKPSLRALNAAGPFAEPEPEPDKLHKKHSEQPAPASTNKHPTSSSEQSNEKPPMPALLDEPRGQRKDEAPTALGVRCRPATPCPATCVGGTCDEFNEINDETCTFLEEILGCDCRGCACEGEERPLAWPEAHAECCEEPEACSEEACDLVTGSFFVCFAAEALSGNGPTPQNPWYYNYPGPYFEGCVSCCDSRLCG